MLNNLRIATRLYLSSGILLAFLITLWGVGKWGMSSFQGAVSHAFQNDVKILEHASRARANALGLRRFEKDMFLNIDSAQSVEKYYRSWDEERGRMNARIADLEKLAERPEDRQLVSEIKEQLGKYQAGIVKTRQRIQSGEIRTPQEANQAVAEIKDATHKVVEMSQHLATETLQRVAATEGQLGALAEKITNTTLAISIAALFVGVLAALRIARSITVPLEAMRKTIAEVASQRDFTRLIPVSGADEVGEAAQSFNNLAVEIQTCLGQVLGSVAKVSDAARGLSTAAAQVAASSAQQSEATASMAAAVEELSTSVNQVSDNARAAQEISRKAGVLSADGGEVIHQAAAEMSQTSATVSDASHAIAELGEQSNRISSIVQVIREVADQTNLLALNAAIEAARAGEQGRGFAVVADEVRKLAERTSNATEEITQMITAIQQGSQAAVATMNSAVERVSEGVSLASQAGSAIIEIKSGAEHVVSVVSEISAALSEQSSASNDIAGQVEKVAQMTEENSAAAMQSAGAANHLQELAGEMETAVRRFKI